MDAQQTWDEILEHWSNEEFDKVTEKSLRFKRWLQKGNPPPNVCPQIPLDSGEGLHRAMAIAACGVLHLSCFFFHAETAKAEVSQELMELPANVPLVLTCSECKNQGPTLAEDALNQGWVQIESIPNSPVGKFLGICPVCHLAD